MAKQKLRKYELIYLVQPEAEDAERERIAGRVNEVLEEYGALLLKEEDWGKRKLAYEIRKHAKAYYAYLVYVSKPGTTSEVERVLRMLDNCVRFQHIKLEDGIDPDSLADMEPATREVKVASDDEDAAVEADTGSTGEEATDA
jgi:small subunit ribosomal protein S6